MKCSNVIVPGFEQTNKIKNPGLETKIESGITEKEREVKSMLSYYGIPSEEYREKWRKSKPGAKFEQDPELAKIAQERFRQVTNEEPMMRGGQPVLDRAGNPRMKYTLDKQKYAETQPAWEAATREILPIKPLGKLPDTPSYKEMAMALDINKTLMGLVETNKSKADGKYKKYIPEGSTVDARLDIPAYLNTNTWVVALNAKELKGKQFAKTAHLKNVTFPISDTEAVGGLQIATGTQSEMGKAKFPYAVMRGEWVNTEASKARHIATKALKSDEWVEIGMNPYRDVYFYRKDTGERIEAVDEVVQIGPLVMARGIR